MTPIYKQQLTNRLCRMVLREQFQPLRDSVVQTLAPEASRARGGALRPGSPVDGMDGTVRKNEREHQDAQLRDRRTGWEGFKWLQTNAGLGSLNVLSELCQQEVPRRISRALPLCPARQTWVCSCCWWFEGEIALDSYGCIW